MGGVDLDKGMDVAAQLVPYVKHDVCHTRHQRLIADALPM